MQAHKSKQKRKKIVEIAMRANYANEGMAITAMRRRLPVNDVVLCPPTRSESLGLLVKMNSTQEVVHIYAYVANFNLKEGNLSLAHLIHPLDT